MDKKLKILVLGNLLIENDNLPLKVLPKLKKEFPKIEFQEIDAIELKDKTKNIKNLIILDSVENLSKVKLFEFKTLNDFEKIQANKIFSIHDFDLGYNLKLLKKLNLIDSVKIIGVPMNVDEEGVFQEISEIIRDYNT